MIKYLGRKFLRPFKLQETLEYLDADVFSQSKFKHHVTQVAQNLELDEEIVRKVIKSYVTNVAIVIGSIQKVKTKINIYGFLTLFVKSGTHHKKPQNK